MHPMRFATLRSAVLLSALVAVGLAAAPCALAQPFGGGAGDNPTSDTSRTPFRVKLSGFLNAKPEEGSRAVKLGISVFRETYQFELVKIEAVDDPQIGQTAMLQQVGKYLVDFNLIGSRDLLSKIGQSEPGTPLTIIGFFQQRSRTLQLESVDVMGMRDY